MPYVPMSELFRLLREANYWGKEGRRIVVCQENPKFSASHDKSAQFITGYDNGPRSATESW